MISSEKLIQIAPKLNKKDAIEFTAYILSACKEFAINTPLRMAAFIAQVAHESNQFRDFVEIWGPTAAQKRYEPPTKVAKRLGNLYPGDGFKYRGRGPIQLTGRGNYRRFGNKLGLDLEKNPDLAAKPEIGFRIAARFWSDRGCNELADRGYFDQITIKINGGLNGKASRDRLYAIALKVC